MGDLGDTRPLNVFMPGAFASMGAAIGAGFTAHVPNATLEFHRFIPSGLLAAAIRDGSPADVYVSANRRYMRELQQCGLVRDYHILAGNRLCMIAPPHTAGHIRQLEHLAQPGLRLVVPQHETDPCGQYVVMLFERAGLAGAMQAKHERGELLYSRGFGDLPGFLADGRADIGILYQSEAHMLGAAIHLIELPARYQLAEKIAFTIAPVWREARLHPHAMPLIQYLTSPSGQALLVERGFLPATSVPSQADGIPGAADGR